MGSFGRLGRRAFIGLALSSLPAEALARAIVDDVSDAPALRRARGLIGLAASAPGPYPYSPGYGARPLRILTQLHDHTTESDGAKSPTELVAAYRDAGYGALAITDHDLTTGQPEGLGARLLGDEHSPATGHVGAVNAAYQRGGLADTQAIVDQVVARGGIAILNHPNWTIGYSDEQLAGLKGYLGIEIHNATCVGLTAGHRGFAVEKWDTVLTRSRPDVWGFSTDDYHISRYERGYDIGRVVVFARSAGVADVLDSLRKGCFVADVSNFGVTPSYPRVTRGGVSIHCPGAVAIRFVGDAGTLLSEVAGPAGEYAFAGAERYVRIEAVGDYAEGFDADLDWANRWGQTVIGSGMSWQVAGGILQQTDASPDPKFAWLKRHIGGDVDLTIDCRFDRLPQSGERSGPRIGFQASTRGHGYALVPNLDGGTFDLYRYDDGVPTRLQSSAGFTPGPGEWYTARLRYAHRPGQIQARWWPHGTAEPAGWALDAVDRTYREGAICLWCRSAASFDNLYVRGFKTYYQPIPVAAAMA